MALNAFKSWRNRSLLCHWLQASLLVGGPGTGKTAIINQFLSHFPEHEYSSKTITFSSLTTPAIFQTFIEVSLLSKKGPCSVSAHNRWGIVTLQDNSCQPQLPVVESSMRACNNAERNMPVG